MQQVILEETALPHQHVIENYRSAYKAVHGREPHIRYAGNQWFFVNNEAVHQAMVVQEIARLRELTQKQTLLSADKSIINRIIARLRSL